MVFGFDFGLVWFGLVYRGGMIGRLIYKVEGSRQLNVAALAGLLLARFGYSVYSTRLDDTCPYAFSSFTSC